MQTEVKINWAVGSYEWWLDRMLSYVDEKFGPGCTAPGHRGRMLAEALARASADNYNFVLEIISEEGKKWNST